MKETRHLAIADRVFTLPDLQRVAQIFNKESRRARDAGEHARASYTVDFADDTSIEGDDAAILTEDLFARPARPTRVDFAFFNYEKDRSLSFSISHGGRGYGNAIKVSGDDPEWVAKNFLSLKEAIETVRPQFSVPRRHKRLILHPIALGIGSLWQLGFDILIGILLVHFGAFDGFSPLPEDSSLRVTIIALLPFIYVLGWVWRWMLGLFWGAFAVRSWVLDLWPSIEFDFGPAHHHIERRRRRRLAAVSSLVVVPIAITIIYDFVRYAF